MPLISSSVPLSFIQGTQQPSAKMTPVQDSMMVTSEKDAGHSEELEKGIHSPSDSVEAQEEEYHFTFGQFLAITVCTLSFPLRHLFLAF